MPATPPSLSRRTPPFNADVILRMSRGNDVFYINGGNSEELTREMLNLMGFSYDSLTRAKGNPGALFKVWRMGDLADHLGMQPVSARRSPN